ncbi:HNH endonuclease [Reyranella sp.]|uniref:HNH endonuclease n=1 Tax=Reyranella sp. TaxID=1929291 RepID=UPI003D0DA4DC
MPTMPPRHRPPGQLPRAEAERRRKALYDRQRPSARKRGYDARWERESKEFLAQPGNEFCACGCGRRADMVDHRVAHKGDPRLFWDRANWQPMARQCNSAKAAREEGAFGNRPRIRGGRPEEL